MSDSKSPDLAQYACDFCKQRKVRCSREKPQCTSCKSMSGKCVYSRRGRISRRPRTNILDKTTRLPGGASSAPNSFPLHISDGSNDISFLPPSTSINQLKDGSTSPNPNTKEPEIDMIDSDMLDSKDMRRNLKLPAHETSYSTPIFSQAKNSINSAVMEGCKFEPGLKSDATKKLSDLTNVFSQITLEESDIFRNVRNFRRQREVFFIPEKEEGEQMIQAFMTSMNREKTILMVPPLELIPKIVFEPETVSERAWLLLFNCVLSARYALLDPSNKRINNGFQWNTWMVLQDSTMFLEGNDFTIQALWVVACYNHEIISPSLCWSYISGACRMAQTLNLHTPSSKFEPNSQENRQRNHLFWNLFIVDKSLSLTFGRPPFLPYYQYKLVPPQDISWLSSFRPHQFFTRNDADPPTRVQRLSGNYGFIHCNLTRELALIQGKILDSIYFASVVPLSRSTIRNELDLWKNKLDEIISIYFPLAGDPVEMSCIHIGLNFLTFQYHYLIVYLARSNKEDHECCLTNARAAISTIDKLVSDSQEPYNGIVWQLLYGPFMPYFVIFSNIISNPRADTCFDDLQLLRKVVIYFLRMHNNHRSAKKLEQIAETFTRLAESYVRNVIQNIPSQNGSQFDEYREMQLDQSHQPAANIGSNPDVDAPAILQQGERFPSNDNFMYRSDHSIEMSENPCDPTLLGFLSCPVSDGSRVPPLVNIPHVSEYLNNSIPNLPLFPDQSTQQPGLFPENHVLDSSFDWFSWETYARDDI